MDKPLQSKKQVSVPKNKLYPAFLKLEGKVCVVVGGGSVAARKVRPLLVAGAHVMVVSIQLNADLQDLLAEGAIEYVPVSYAAEHLPDASLIFAATNNAEVNRLIVHDAHERGLWVNVADNPDAGDFYVPATIQRQQLTVAVSTGGGSPAFARYVREFLEQSLSAAFGQALEMIAQARPLIFVQAKEHQAQLWKSLLALHLETVIEVQGEIAARQLFEQWLEQHIGS